MKPSKTIRRSPAAVGLAGEPGRRTAEHEARMLRGALAHYRARRSRDGAGAVSRPATDEAALLAETRRFVTEVLDRLQDLIARSRALRKRLRQTRSYGEVDGKDEAEQVPTWSAAATLEINLELAAKEMADTLRRLMRTEPWTRARQEPPAGGPQ